MRSIPNGHGRFNSPPESLLEYEQVGRGTIRRDVANGLEEGGKVLCNGLIADWSEWFYQRSSQSVANAFAYLEEVVSILSHPSEPIHCEGPQKVFLTDSRKFPMLRMPYGLVPCLRSKANADGQRLLCPLDTSGVPAGESCYRWGA